MRTGFHKAGFSRYGIVAGIALLCGAVSASTLPHLPTGQSDRSASVSRRRFEIPAMPVTLPGQQPLKEDKCYPSVRKPYRRPGVSIPLTTLINIHTRQVIPVFEKVPLEPAHLRELFQCRGFAVSIDPAPDLVATAVAAATHFKSPEVIVISGYRSEKFNDILGKKGRNVAGESRHSKGEALDFRLTTADAVALGRWLDSQYDGGLGVYARDNFVHIDVGPRRRWRGR